MAKPSSANPAKVAVTLRGREYMVSCDSGEEKRLQETVKLVENTLGKLAEHNDNIAETRLFMLACLMLADELIDYKRNSLKKGRAEEDLMVAAVEHLRQRVATIAQQVGHA
jgi:cell division protein ZapA